MSSKFVQFDPDETTVAEFLDMMQEAYPDAGSITLRRQRQTSLWGCFVEVANGTYRHHIYASPANAIRAAVGGYQAVSAIASSDLLPDLSDEHDDDDDDDDDYILT